MVLRTYLVYNTVVRLCQFFCCGEKLNFIQIFWLNDNLRKFLLGFFILQKQQDPNFLHDCFSKISRTFFIQKCGSTTLQSLSFLKNIEILCKWKLVNNHTIPSKQQFHNHDSFSKISRPSTA